MKAALTRIISRLLTSRSLRDLRRRRAARGRQGGRPVIAYFHQADDPYSHLALQALAPLAARYRVKIQPWLVPPPDDAAAPDRQRLRQYGVRDAQRVAAQYGLAFPADAVLPSPQAVSVANAILAAALGEDFAARALEVGTALWSGDHQRLATLATQAADDDSAAALAAGQAERERLGHYLGGMFHMEGEWYWGVDRLNHLEERLAGLGLDSQAGITPIAPYRDIALAAAPRAGARPVIEAWFSFRSPYSWIFFPRVRRLAAHYGADLRLRYILPMVMRGLPVPRIKSRYIMLDTKREADRVGLPFGKVVDPVGAGAERALAVAHYATALGLTEDFAELAMRGAFAEGIDLAGDAGLYDIAGRAGLTSAQVDAALADETWRETAEANRLALFEAGLWGAPSFRVNGGPAHWGQDRLWALEEDLVAATR